MILRLRQFGLALYFILVGNMLFPVVAQESANPADASFLIRSWQTEQGLPNNTVSAIAQTRDGYLWLGTGEGLARFDGVNCRVLGVKDGLESLRISALLEDRQGTLWIGTAGGGLSRYVHGAIETLTLKDGLAGMSINALLEDTNGDVWIGTPTGLNRWRNGRFESPIKDLSSIHIRDLAKDQQGGIWIATLYDGLWYFQNGQILKINIPAEFTLNDKIPDCLLVDSKNALWVGMHDGAVLCHDQEQWVRYGVEAGSPQFYITRLAETADGTIWAGSWKEGLYYFRNGRFNAVRKGSGLSDDDICSLCVDRAQHLWVGTRTGGLNCISPKKLSVYQLLPGSIECVPNSLAQTTDGELWVGVFGQGLFHWRGGQFEQFLKKPPISNHLFVESLLAAKDGSLWWGVSAVLYQWKDGKLASAYEAAWMKGDRILSLCENSSGGIWVGTFNGQLQLLQQEQFIPVNGLPGNPVTALAQETDGTLWIGTDGGGLARLRNGKLSVLTVKDGLRSNLIRALFLDSEGTLWIGTDGGGLGRWSNGRLVTYTAEQGLISDTILQILEDDDGCLWLGSNRGVWRVSKLALNNVAKDQTASVHPLAFGYSEGMPSEQCVGNFGAALKTRAGELCFSTEKGIVVIDPQRQSHKVVLPMVLLEDVLVDGQKLDALHPAPKVAGLRGSTTSNGADEISEIAPGKHSFDFYYTGLSFDAPEKIQFKCRLEGLDSDWTDAGRVRVARYSYIPPGRYRFQVTACNSDGQWNAPGAEFSFIILPHYWQTTWFLVSSLVMLLGLVGGGIRYFERRRYRARVRRLELEQAMERERARIARDLHDELGASLTHISMLSHSERSRDNNADQLKKRVGKILDFSLRTARSLDEIVWAVNPRNDSLRSLLEYLTQFARELFEDTGINCRFQIPDDLPQAPLPPEMRHNIFLVAKEALNNSLKHARATEVSLDAKTQGPQIEISIQDNGTGFDLGAMQTRSKRSGLKNMRERTESLGGQLRVATATGKGTTVKLTINLPALSKP